MRDYALDEVFSNPDSTLHNKSPNQTVSKFIDIPRYIYSESYFTKLNPNLFILEYDLWDIKKIVWTPKKLEIAILSFFG